MNKEEILEIIVRNQEKTHEIEADIEKQTNELRKMEIEELRMKIIHLVSNSVGGLNELRRIYEEVSKTTGFTDYRGLLKNVQRK